MTVPTGESSIAVPKGARQRVACADGYTPQDGNNTHYLSCDSQPSSPSVQATTKLRCVPTCAVPPCATRQWSNLGGPNSTDGPGAWPSWLDPDILETEGIIGMPHCKPFDLAGRHMLGGIDILGCEIVERIGKPCRRTVDSLKVEKGHVEKVVCAPGYTLRQAVGWLNCTQGGLAATTALNCVATATPTRADTPGHGERVGGLVPGTILARLPLGAGCA